MMSDIKKALDEYRKFTPGKTSEKDVEKYVFKSFESKEDKNRPFVKETDSKNQLKTLPGDAPPAPGKTEKPQGKTSNTGIQKAAKMLLLLGGDEAASVLKHFKPDEIEKIAAEVIKIRQIDKNEAEDIFRHLKRKVKLKDTFTGGVDTARNILHKAFGEEKGEAVLNQALPETREKPFDFLEDIDPVQIKIAMKDEPVSMVSLILNYLKPEKSAAILKEFPKDKQKDIILRMASGGMIRREIIEKMENIIKEKVRTQGNVITRHIDGKNRLANILKFMDLDNEEKILEEISDFDPELSEEISSQVYTMDIIHGIQDIYMQKVLLDFTEKEIAVILKGRDKNIKEKILSSLSKTRRTLVEQESDYLGIMRKSEVNIVTREFIEYIRQAEKDGTIVITRPGDIIV